MKSTTAHRLATKAALAPIMARIRDRANQGYFVLYLLKDNNRVQITDALTALGYKVEQGKDAELGAFIRW